MGDSMAYISATDFAGTKLDTCELYMDRFGGVIVVSELTSLQVAMAAKLGIAELASSDGGIQLPDNMKRQQLTLALSLRDGNTGEPLFGHTPEDVLPHLAAVENIGWRDHLLIVEVHDRLSDGTLTLDEREYLKQPNKTLDQLDYLRLGEKTAAAVTKAAEENGDAEKVYEVALRVPQVLFGSVPMSVVNKLHEAILREREIQTGMLAMQLAAMLTPPEE